MTSLKVAIVQAAPVPLAIDFGITQLVELVGDAIDTGAQLIAFGETFLGGYPLWLDEAPGAALWDHKGTQGLHAILLDQAIRAGDPRLAPLQALVDKAGVLVSVGAHERVRGSLYNAQLLFRPGEAPLVHRKLVPTHGERMIWGRGDGSTLGVHQADWGNVGQAICWEHWMPFLRAALHHSGESVHVAAWPTVREAYAVASRHYAFEGRCYVLAAGTIQHRDHLLEGLALVGHDAEVAALLKGMPDGWLQTGGSLIAAPDTTILAQAGTEPDILVADLDLSVIGRGLTSLDTDGHYARPDVFELHVDRRAKAGVTTMANGSTRL
ncbi:MAG: carbon-nitrogen hydrolase family protein [Pseudomonadota bacterium]